MHRLIGLIAILALLAPATLLAQHPEPPQIQTFTDAATLDQLQVDLDIRDGATIARYELQFSNRSSRFAEGRIILPVPPNSAVSELVLTGGPETLEGTVVPADEARRIYQDIVRRLIDPALLQSIGADLYEVRAFPVPRGEQRQVSFTVTTPLLAEFDQVLVEIPWSRMSPRPATAMVSGEIDVSWDVRSAVAPTYNLDVERLAAGHLALGWEAPFGWRADTDFNLYLGGGEGLLDTRLLPYRVPGDDGFFALLLAPEIETDSQVARDIILVLDTSGSMEGEKIEQARAAARFVLERLGQDDRFGIVSYSGGVRIFGEGLHPASEAAAGIAFVEGRRAGGSTNISTALSVAFDLADGDRPATILFLTDGLPTAGLEDPSDILDLARDTNPGRTQLFAFGLGFDVNTLLLDSLSREFVGTSHYVTPQERVDEEVSRLFERISSPVLTDVEIEIEGANVTALAPRIITGIFAGTQTLLTGRYGEPGTVVVRVSGNTDSGRETFTYELNLPERALGDPTIAQLWAQQRVADLLAELRLEGSRPALIEEIVEVATRFGIVTQFTSFLAREPELRAFFGEESAEQAADSVEQAFSAAAPIGEAAVEQAMDEEELSAGNARLGTEQIRVVGAHSYVLIDGVWIQNGFDPDADVADVLVGSDEFAELMQAQPDLARAAALGTEVIAATDGGFVRIVWPDPASVDEVTLPDLTSGNGAGTDVVTDPDPVRTLDSGATDPSETGSDPVDSGQDPVSPPDATTPALIDPDSGSGGSTALWIGIGIALAVLALGMGTALTRRSRRSV
ncbi:MAG: VWA domain-containing protein [Chloroflexi bacterium]|nr:VWA domain-containing protein [Chloroflexota bacterium]